MSSILFSYLQPGILYLTRKEPCFTEVMKQNPIPVPKQLARIKENC